MSAQAGNYVRDGILAGIRRFVDEGDDDAAAEVHVGYGKDYCAAVGACVMSMNMKEYRKPGQGTFPFPLEKAGAGEAPPYWDELNRWYVRQSVRLVQHQARVHAADGTAAGAPVAGAGGKRQDPGPDSEATEMHELATVGIYEGETVVFPVIAAGDLDTLRWLLLPPIEGGSVNLRLGQGLTDGSGPPRR